MREKFLSTNKSRFEHELSLPTTPTNGPNCASANSIALIHSSSTVTSRGNHAASPPAALISATTFFPASSNFGGVQKGPKQTTNSVLKQAIEKQAVGPAVSAIGKTRVQSPGYKT
jgi:hypothetical protein